MPVEPAPPHDPAAPSVPATTAGRLDEQLCFALYATTNAIIRLYRPLLKEIGLTYPQYLVLLTLWETPLQVGEIAERLRLASHAVSPMLDRLEQHDLVRRTRPDGDGRVVLVELTDAGRRLEAHAAQVQEHVRCATMLEPDEVDRLRSDLHALLERLDGI